MPDPDPETGATAEAPTRVTGLPEGLTNRGVILTGEDPAVILARAKETQRAVESARRAERRKATSVGSKTVKAARAKSTTQAGGDTPTQPEIDDVGGWPVESHAPHVTISPTFEAPYYEAPVYGAPINVNSPDMNQTIEGSGGGSGRGGNGGNDDPDRRGRPDDDPDRRVGRDDDEVERLRNGLEEANGRLQEQEQRYQELEERRQELQDRFDALEQANQELQERLNRLENPPPPAGPSPEEVERANDEVVAAREALAAIDIRRSARITDRFTGRRRRDREAYEVAAERYQRALENMAQLTIEFERTQGHSDEEIEQTLTLMKYSEDEDYAQSLVDINDRNFNNLTGFRRRWAGMFRRVANMPNRYKYGVAIGLGAGVGLASITLGAGLGLLAAGAAARYSWGLIHHEASLRNQTRVSFDRTIRKIARARQEALANLNGGSVDTHGRELSAQTLDERRASTSGNIKRNRRGSALLLGGAALSALGIGHAAGLDLPNFGSWLKLHGPDWPKWLHLPNFFHHHHVNPNTQPKPNPNSTTGGPIPPGLTAGGPIHPGAAANHAANVDFSHFRPDQFKAHTPHQAVRGMFDVFRDNGIKVRGDNNKAIAAIIRDMESHHWHLASGMADHHGHQNIVDLAHDWADGHTQNYLASAEQGFRKIGGPHGSSIENAKAFMKLAQRHGLKFVQESR